MLLIVPRHSKDQQPPYVGCYGMWILANVRSSMLREWREVVALQRAYFDACDFPPFAFERSPDDMVLVVIQRKENHHASGKKYLVSAPDSNRLHSVYRTDAL